jgi:hypothetical protein
MADASEYMLNTPEKLQEGEIYFDVSFFDRDSYVPMIGTWVYIGENLSRGDAKKGGRWYFQDPESYSKHGNAIDLPKRIRREIIKVDETVASCMFTLDGLAEALKTFRPHWPEKIAKK